MAQNNRWSFAFYQAVQPYCCQSLKVFSIAGGLNRNLWFVLSDMDSWRFPRIKSCLCGHNLSFHFYDSPDNSLKAKLDFQRGFHPWVFSVAGRLNGTLRLGSNDVGSWRFPVIKGRFCGHDLPLHFFDAPDDDFSRTKLHLPLQRSHGDGLFRCRAFEREAARGV